MPTISEDEIRERAHQIWMEEGCPNGRELEHWEQACRELEHGDGAKSDSNDLDEALADSFPASDPIALTPVAGVGGSEEDEDAQKNVVEARFAGAR